MPDRHGVGAVGGPVKGMIGGLTGWIDEELGLARSSATWRFEGIEDDPFDGIEDRYLSNLYAVFPDIWRVGCGPAAIDTDRARHLETSGMEEVQMADLVDIAIPAGAQATAEALGFKVQRSVLSGARVRQIPRYEAELAVAYLREWGFSARILEHTPEDGPDAARAA